MNGADILVTVLAIAGGGAIGAALGGGLGGAFGWRGGGLHAAIGSACVAGAAAGIFFTSGASLPSLGGVLPKLERLSDAAETERVVKAYYPSDYQTIEAKIRAMQALGASQAEINSAVRSQALPLFQRAFPNASTENVNAYYDVVRDEQKAIEQHPALCLRAASPQGMSEVAAALPDELKEREARLITRILEQAATRPQPPHPPADFDAELKIWSQDAYWALSFEDRDALKGAGGEEAQGKATCEVVDNLLGMIAFYTPDQKAETFKALEARGMQQLSS